MLQNMGKTMYVNLLHDFLAGQTTPRRIGICSNMDSLTLRILAIPIWAQTLSESRNFSNIRF